MNILLISPPVFDFYSTSHRMEPLGLLYIKKALLNAGHSVDIYDATASGKVKKQKLPEEFQYLATYYEEDHSPFSLHSGYKRFGDSFTKICEFIIKGKYDIIGISSLFSAYHPDVENLVSEIKNVFSNPVVIGGTAIGAQKELLGKETNADYLIYGCGTVSMVQFADAVSGKIHFSEVAGLIYKENGEVFINKPSIESAWTGGIIPQREDFRIYKKKKIAKTVFSSGCKNKCSFCSIHRANVFERRDISHIKKELEYLLKLGVQIVDIEDDDIFSDTEFAIELIELLKHFHKLGLEFTAMNGLTAKNIVHIADKLSDAGFIKLDLSLVSGSGKVSSELNRPHGLSEIEAINKAVNGKIEIEVFLIPGLPGTSLQNTLETMLRLHKMGIKCGLSPLYLVPGVPMFEKTGIPENLRLCRGSAIYPFNENERADIAALLKISRFLNYLLSGKNDGDAENSKYFQRSILRKQWFKKSLNGEWSDSFTFSEDFSKPIITLTQIL
ncbi:MAG TPA: cobalamin-dependent protein [bacterium]|nr:cobalamin-dependent protein [bacterium]HPS29532.1 cobalamin-dependent protein [bacterium]